MSLERLQINAFRCFQRVDLELSPTCNLFFGPNASGKTSLIEAIHFVSLGRSFRANNNDLLVRKGEPGFSVMAKIRDKGNVGRECRVSKRCQDKSQYSIDGQPVRGLAEFGRLLPIQVVTHEGFLLLDGSPQHRRRFLDYGAFHVEHQFIQCWKAYRTLHAQRNQLLRTLSRYNNELAAWDKELSRVAHDLDLLRSAYWTRFLEYFEIFSKVSNIEGAVNLHYQRGWRSDEALDNLLRENFESDRKSGYTKNGPHRFDIKFQMETGLAKNFLSRGQQKLFFYALLLAQVSLLHDKLEQRVILAIDDFTAEVDEDTQESIADMLKLIAEKTQFFFTSLDETLLKRIKWLHDLNGDERLFRVEKGSIQPH